MARSIFPLVRLDKVVGLGGGGSNAVNRMVRDGVDGLEFIAEYGRPIPGNHRSSTRIQLVEACKRLGAAATTMSAKSGRRMPHEIREVVNGAEMYSLPLVWAAARARFCLRCSRSCETDRAVSNRSCHQTLRFEGSHRMAVGRRWY